MKNEMRKDLMITREDILLHLSAQDTEPDDEESLAPAGAADAFLRFLCRLFKRDD